MELRQTFEKEIRSLKRRGGGYARQYRRVHRMLKRQRTIPGLVMRTPERRLSTLADGVEKIATLWLGRARRIHGKHKLYALHAPEVAYIGKSKPRQPYEFGVKVGIATTEKDNLIVGARAFAPPPYDGHFAISTACSGRRQAAEVSSHDTRQCPRKLDHQ